ncbi:YitT family protein [Lacticaseibacillus jixiensis]|uniref:YitT family protein n=1 Tax=Lacticaseibacillus jixiensis TaxID=3231926 RepID=UPI0036F419D0
MNLTRSLAKIALGDFVMALAYAQWVVPQRLINGGVTSLALILTQSGYGNVPLWTNVLTIGLLIACWKWLGRENLLKSAFSSIAYILSFDLCAMFHLQYPAILWLDLPLASLAIAFGYYCCLSEGASTVGVDVIALIWVKFHPHMSVAALIRDLNLIVLMLGALVLGWRSVLLGVVFSVLYTVILNRLLKEQRLCA